MTYDDEPWTDGHRPHPACGWYLDEHAFELGTGFVCPDISPPA